MNISLNEILFYLGPQSGNIAFNILLYIIFFLSLYVLLRMPDKNLLPTLLMAGVLLVCVIAKLNISAATREAIFPPAGFIQFVQNVCTLIFPLLTAGTVRARKKSVVVVPSIVTAVFGGVYFFAFWFFVQRTG